MKRWTVDTHTVYARVSWYDGVHIISSRHVYALWLPASSEVRMHKTIEINNCELFDCARTTTSVAQCSDQRSALADNVIALPLRPLSTGLGYPGNSLLEYSIYEW